MIHRKKREKESWSKNRDKKRLTVTLPPELKDRVKEELEHSSLTMSDLVEEKFKEFLDENINPDALYDKVEEIQCSECDALLSSKALEKNQGKCPGCGKDIR
ncbi:MAG: hypothetical protein ABEK16_04605 [Candidatus Nanohalobium sp.]